MNPKANKYQRFLTLYNDQRVRSLFMGFKLIEKAVMVVLIPLCVAITSHEGFKMTTCFYLALLILLLSICFKLDSLLFKKETSMDKGPQLKIVNRHKVDSSVGFANILNMIRDSEAVQIISPPKPAETPDPNRLQYLEKIEAIVQTKLKIDGSFTYQRLIPAADHSSLLNDEALHRHCQQINQMSNGLTNVYCKLIDEVQSQYHFVMIDAKILILFFPKYTFASGVAQVADACSFHLQIINDEESPLLRYLRQQHAALAKDGVSSVCQEKTIRSPSKSLGHLSVRSNSQKGQVKKNHRGFSLE